MTFQTQHAQVAQVTYDGHVHLGEELWQRVGQRLGMPHINEEDLKLLDEAISILNPPEAHVRVVEVDTFMVRRRKVSQRMTQPQACSRSTKNKWSMGLYVEHAFCGSNRLLAGVDLRYNIIRIFFTLVKAWAS